MRTPFLFAALIAASLPLAAATIQVSLTKPGIESLFNQVPMLKSLGLVDASEIGGFVSGRLSNPWNGPVKDFSYLIQAGSIRFVNGSNVDATGRQNASLPLSRTEVPMVFSAEAKVALEGRVLDGVFSMWGNIIAPEETGYLAIKLKREFSLRDFAPIAKTLRLGDYPFASRFETYVLKDPEILYNRQAKTAIVFGVAMVENHPIDCYLFTMPAEDGSRIWAMAFDYGGLQVDVARLASKLSPQIGGILAKQNLGGGGFNDAILLLASKAGKLDVGSTDPVLAVPFSKLYGKGSPLLPLPYVRGLSVFAAFVPQNFPEIAKQMQRLNIPTSSSLMLSGSIGAGNDAGNAGGGGSGSGSLQCAMSLALSAWDLPQTWKSHGYKLVQGATAALELMVVPSAAQLGVASEFLINIGGKQPNGLKGALEVVATSSDYGVALAGSMTGALQMPYKIPVAIKDPVVKVKWTTDDSYFVGCAGETFLGNKWVTTGGDIAIQYTGEEAHPKAGALKLGASTLKVKDLVDLSNIMVAIKSGNWTPWNVPSAPVAMRDIYDAELDECFVEFVTPGGADADLGFSADGCAGRGTLKYKGQAISKVGFSVTANGVSVYGDVASFRFGQASFDGAKVDIAATLTDVPHFFIKTGFDVQGERAAVDFALATDAARVNVTLPKTLKSLAHTAAVDVIKVLQKIESIGADQLAIANPDIIAGEALNWGYFKLDNARMWVENAAGKLNLKVRGALGVLGSVVPLDGVYDIARNVYVLSGIEKGSFKLGDYEFSYSSLELIYDGRIAAAKASGLAAKSDLRAELIIDIPRPANCSGGSASTSVYFKNKKVAGCAASLTYADGTATLTIDVADGFDMSHFDLSGLDLRNADFSKVNLNDCNLMNADFRGAKFQGASIKAANLNNSKFDGANFEGADLGRSALTGGSFDSAKFTNAKLPGADLTKAIMTKAHFEKAVLDNAKFEGADLKGAVLKGGSFKNADLRKVDLEGHDLTNADFSAANLSGIDIMNANLSNSRFDGANFQGANLLGSSANFRPSILKGGSFKNADFRKVDLSKLNLASADFSGANFAGIDILSANLSNSKFEGANFDGTNLQGANLKGAVLKGGSFKNADLRKVDLEGHDLTNADFTGANLSGIDIMNANLSNSKFDGANFQGANLIGSSANFRPSTLTGGSFKGADFRKIDLSRVNLANTDFSGANFAGIDIVSADLSNSKFDGVNFDGTNLQGANLTKATFEKAVLDNANLSKVIGSYTVFTKAHIVKADFTDANLQDVRLGGANLQNSVLQRANLKYAILEDADLSYANLQGSCLQAVKASRLRMHHARADGLAGQKGEYFNADITYCDMSDAIWDSSNFTDATVQDIKWVRSSLENADFTRAKLNTGVFDDCVLRQTRFYGANLGGTKIRNADWDGAVLDGGTMFNNAEVKGGKNLNNVVNLAAAVWTGTSRDFDPSKPPGGGGSGSKPRVRFPGP